ncbi:MAG: flavodoxin domain-containing protein [Idiomarina sp.]
MSRIDILVGTTSGNTEYLADQVQEQLQQAGLTTEMHYEPDFDALTEQAGPERIWLCLVASHGAGDYGDSMLDFAEQLEHRPPQLAGLKYAVIAIGESCYDTYCAAGRDLDQRLNDAAAMRLLDRLEIDMMEDDPEQLTPIWVQKFINICV